MPTRFPKPDRDPNEKSLRQRLLAGEKLSGQELWQLVGDPSVPNVPASEQQIMDEIAENRKAMAYHFERRDNQRVRLYAEAIAILSTKLRELQEQRAAEDQRAAMAKEEMSQWFVPTKQPMFRFEPFIPAPAQPLDEVDPDGVKIQWGDAVVEDPEPQRERVEAAPAYDPANPPKRVYDL